MHLFLTAEGKKFVREKIEPLMIIENSIYEAMTDAEIREFLRLSQKYNAIFREKTAELLQRSDRI
ncbi:MAG: hypothetical protein Q4C65_14865 [Eubacteriales bacterium]|nr:hypothetical protein [Eubacteriales bacterium]